LTFLQARVQAAQQRSRLAQEKQKQEQQIKVQAEKEDENILVEKLEDTQVSILTILSCFTVLLI